MSQFVSIVIWAIVAYFIAKKVKENYELEIKPIYYSICALFFSLVISMCVLFNKVCKKTGNHTGEIATWIIGGFVAALNILMMFN